jgi:hypothetical protein
MTTPQAPTAGWTPVVQPGGQVRNGAWVAELAVDDRSWCHVPTQRSPMRRVRHLVGW